MVWWNLRWSYYSSWYEIIQHLSDVRPTWFWHYIRYHLPVGLGRPHLLKIFPVELDLLRPPSLLLSSPLISDPRQLLLDALQPFLLPANHLVLLRHLLPLPQHRKVPFDHGYPVGCTEVTRLCHDGALEVLLSLQQLLNLRGTVESWVG